MGLKKILILIFVVCLVKSSSALIINEVMVNPVEDNYDEWVEIYNNNDYEIDLANYSIKDNSNCDIFLFGYQGSVILPGGYGIITDKFSYVYYDFEVSLDALKIRVDDDAIGNGLNNNGDNISLYKDNDCSDIVDSFSYNFSNEGLSWAFVNNNWIEVENITPGYSNSFTKICDPKVEIELDKQIYSNKEVVYFRPKVGGDYKYRIEYWIEDVFGNIVKSKVETENSNLKQWTPKINEEDKVFIIKANLTYSDCDDISLSNNFVKKIFGVQGDLLSSESIVKIDRIYLGNDKKARFGDNLRVKVSIYKADTDKQSIQLWIENGEEISKRTRIHAYDKFTNYNLTLSVQIDPNCNRKYKDDEYNLILEGLDKSDKEEIKVEGVTDSLCQKEEVEKIVYIENKSYEIKSEAYEVKKEYNKSENLINQANSSGLTSSFVYESKGIKAKGFGVWFFVGLLVLITIYFIWRK